MPKLVWCRVWSDAGSGAVCKSEQGTGLGIYRKWARGMEKYVQYGMRKYATGEWKYCRTVAANILF